MHDRFGTRLRPLQNPPGKVYGDEVWLAPRAIGFAFLVRFHFVLGNPPRGRMGAGIAQTSSGSCPATVEVGGIPSSHDRCAAPD
jgi:hypothetical protein